MSSIEVSEHVSVDNHGIHIRGVLHSMDGLLAVDGWEIIAAVLARHLGTDVACLLRDVERAEKVSRHPIVVDAWSGGRGPLVGGSKTIEEVEAVFEAWATGEIDYTPTPAARGRRR